jgi:hypothetical protein
MIFSDVTWLINKSKLKLYKFDLATRLYLYITNLTILSIVFPKMSCFDVINTHYSIKGTFNNLSSRTML